MCSFTYPLLSPHTSALYINVSRLLGVPRAFEEYLGKQLLPILKNPIGSAFIVALYRVGTLRDSRENNRSLGCLFATRQKSCEYFTKLLCPCMHHMRNFLSMYLKVIAVLVKCGREHEGGANITGALNNVSPFLSNRRQNVDYFQQNIEQLLSRFSGILHYQAEKSFVFSSEGIRSRHDLLRYTYSCIANLISSLKLACFVGYKEPYFSNFGGQFGLFRCITDELFMDFLFPWSNLIKS